MSEDRLLQAFEGRAGIDAQLLEQRVATLSIDLQRAGLSSGSVEREHQLLAQSLVQRMLYDELLEVVDNVDRSPKRQFRVDPIHHPG